MVYGQLRRCSCNAITSSKRSRSHRGHAPALNKAAVKISPSGGLRIFTQGAGGIIRLRLKVLIAPGIGIAVPRHKSNIGGAGCGLSCFPKSPFPGYGSGSWLAAHVGMVEDCLFMPVDLGGQDKTGGTGGCRTPFFQVIRLGAGKTGLSICTVSRRG